MNGSEARQLVHEPSGFARLDCQYMSDKKQYHQNLLVFWAQLSQLLTELEKSRSQSLGIMNCPI